MFQIPDWVFEFHGHRCPLMPIGYRMGILALQKLGVGREKDHNMFIYSEMGSAHPMGCMNDGLQAATGCTYGKVMMKRLNYGKLAAIVHHPDKGAVRLVVRPEFINKVAAAEFFKYRSKGIEPSKVPPEVCNEAVAIVLNADEEAIFKVEMLSEFKRKKPVTSFQRSACSKCGEYVFEPYIRIQNGEDLCIPCSGYSG